jgi:hypothetical protein
MTAGGAGGAGVTHVSCACVVTVVVATAVVVVVVVVVVGQDRAETMTTVAVLELLAGLLDFTTQCFPDNLANVDSVLESAVSAVTAQLAKYDALCRVHVSVCACV